MPVLGDNPYNPNPITKLFTTFLFGLIAFHQSAFYFGGEQFFYSRLFFIKTGLKKMPLKISLPWAALLLPNLKIIENTPFVLKMFLLLLLVYRVFYFPLTSGKLLVKTSDVEA